MKELIIRLSAKLERANKKLDAIRNICDNETYSRDEQMRRIDDIVTIEDLLWFELEE